MFPIGDDNSACRKGTATITWAIIAANLLVFVFFQGFGTDGGAISSFAVVPSEILSGRDLVTGARWFVDRATGRRFLVPGLGPTPVWVYLTLVTSMFLHGGIAHVAGNMLFLGIFGDNVECRIGKVRYLFLYLGSGIAGGLAQVGAAALTGSGLDTPMVGASAAVAGLLGSYLVLFPGNRVYVLLFNFIPTALSAWIVIGMWFVMQLLGGLAGPASGGVAYAAHIFGFAAGWLWSKRYAGLERGRIERERRKRVASGRSGDITWWIVEDL